MEGLQSTILEQQPLKDIVVVDGGSSDLYQTWCNEVSRFWHTLLS